jgi:hypothetical protein
MKFHELVLWALGALFAGILVMALGHSMFAEPKTISKVEHAGRALKEGFCFVHVTNPACLF